MQLNTERLFGGVKPTDKQEETSVFNGTMEIKDSNGKTLIDTEELEAIDTCTLDNGYGIEITLTKEGTKKLKEGTEENLGGKLDFFVNGTCVASPEINETIVDGKMQISGFETLTRAYEIVNAVKNGGDVEKTENQKKQEELANELADALKSIGVKEVLNVTYDKYEATGNVMFEVDAHITTDVKELIARCTYLNDKWSVTYINDADTGNMYYPVTGKNAYDYASGECINPAEETETPKEEPQEVPHRDGMYGISDKDVHDIDGTFIRNDVRNDVTGKWRISTIAADVQMEDYALSYYKWYFHNDDEIHAIVNFNYNTTTCIKYLSGQIYVTVHDYVKGEEHDADTLFTGTVLAEYIVYPDNGDIEQIK